MSVNTSATPWLRIPLAAEEVVEMIGSFMQRCVGRDPTARVRLFAYGEFCTLYVPLREGVVVTRDAQLLHPVSIDIETGVETLRQSCLRSFNANLSHIDIPAEAVSFPIPWGEILRLGIAGGKEAGDVVVKAEQIIADTIAKAEGEPDPVAVEQLYQALLDDTVFWLNDMNGQRIDITLRMLWPGVGLGLFNPKLDVVFARCGEWVGTLLPYGSVWVPPRASVMLPTVDLSSEHEPAEVSDLLRLAEELS